MLAANGNLVLTENELTLIVWFQELWHRYVYLLWKIKNPNTTGTASIVVCNFLGLIQFRLRYSQKHFFDPEVPGR